MNILVNIDYKGNFRIEIIEEEKRIQHFILLPKFEFIEFSHSTYYICCSVTVERFSKPSNNNHTKSYTKQYMKKTCIGAAVTQ